MIERILRQLAIESKNRQFPPLRVDLRPTCSYVVPQGTILSARRASLFSAMRFVFYVGRTNA